MQSRLSSNLTQSLNNQKNLAQYKDFSKYLKRNSFQKTKLLQQNFNNPSISFTGLKLNRLGENVVKTGRKLLEELISKIKTLFEKKTAEEIEEVVFHSVDETFPILEKPFITANDHGKTRGTVTKITGSSNLPKDPGTLDKSNELRNQLSRGTLNTDQQNKLRTALGYEKPKPKQPEPKKTHFTGHSETSTVNDHPQTVTSLFEHKADAGTILESKTDFLGGASDLTDHHDVLGNVMSGVSEVADKINNLPVMGTIAEMLPGTKFLKPLEHLAKGELDKAAVTGLTRAAEFFIFAPAKLITTGLGAAGGTIARLLGKKGKGTGALGGAKAALDLWNKGRGAAENFVLGIEKEDQAAKDVLQREIYEKNKEQAINKIRETSQQNIKNRTEQHARDILDLKEYEVSAHKLAQDAHKETGLYQSQAEEAQTALNKGKAAASERYEQLVKEQRKLAENHKAMFNTLSDQMEKAKQEGNAKLQESIKKQMNEMQKAQKSEMDELLKDIHKVSQVVEIFEKMANKSNAEGFGRIAGYKEQIDILLDHFGAPIALEKMGNNVEVPNGILFFGPKGNGKTTFAEAFASHMDCNLVKIQPELDAETNWDNLEKVAKTAEERFKKDRTRTLILINEFDVFAPKGSKIAGVLKDFMDDCSKKYHCTLFATTNYPENVDNILGSFYRAGLPPANKDNASAILKHYAEDFADKGINYDELAEHIVKVQPNAAFSNARIKAVVTSLTEVAENQGRKLKKSDLYQSIINKGPDIKKEALELFNRQLEYVKHL